MRRLLSTIALSLAVGALLPVPGSAKGCIKGAAVGGVAGHLVGHHAVVGAAAGCVIGHHNAKVRDKEAAQAAAHPPGSAARGGAGSLRDSSAPAAVH